MSLTMLVLVPLSWKITYLSRPYNQYNIISLQLNHKLSRHFKHKRQIVINRRLASHSSNRHLKLQTTLIKTDRLTLSHIKMDLYLPSPLPFNPLRVILWNLQTRFLSNTQFRMHHLQCILHSSQFTILAHITSPLHHNHPTIHLREVSSRSGVVNSLRHPSILLTVTLIPNQQRRFLASPWKICLLEMDLMFPWLCINACKLLIFLDWKRKESTDSRAMQPTFKSSARCSIMVCQGPKILTFAYS